MKIIVVGCGKIGTTILEELTAEGHDVIAVDDDPAVIGEIGNLYDVMCVFGNGADCDTLQEAGVETADLFVAVTDSDERNMLSCFLAKRMGAKHTVARIRNPEYNDRSAGFLRQQLDLSDAINPELLAAEEIYKILRLPSAANIDTFSERKFEVVEMIVKPESPLCAMRLLELRKKSDANFLVCVVQRKDQIYIPDGNFVLEAGDRIGITASPDEIQKLLKEFGLLKKHARNVILFGASRTAYYLAKLLLADGNKVKIIDKDKERCAEFADLLPGAVVICGDGARQEVLLEEGIRAADAFVALTGSDEENILISCFVTSLNISKVITKVNRAELASMAERLGTDTIVSPRKIVSSLLTGYARALQNASGSNLEALYHLMDGKAELLAFRVKEDFKHVGIPLKQMQFKKNILIAGIVRGRTAIIPTGEDQIQPNDKVIVLAAGQRLQDLSDMIR